MNFNITDNITSLLKLPNKIVASIALSTGLILFLPDSIINKLYINSLKDKYGFVVGFIFLSSVSILFVSCVILIYKKSYSYINFKKNYKKILINLSLSEKVILGLLFHKANHTLELPLHDGVIKSLEQKSIISRTTNQYVVEDLSNPKFPYMLNSWVVEKLQNDKQLFSLVFDENENIENEIDDILKEILS